ncbi:B-cell lymphoma 3-encoded protein [Colletotrichum higginsianum IMI 349063]|uniref:B-cell lymphoma 3-encoded protein n=2 Tax=Colletotrichum higginsianum (strain IMI 349063) TaxID=759273 RepID=A0A1B7XTH6_COLHI|nr:B-cell lymphoma 3-encoded protein [Colletotrichum higginsianum IMI 349063]OBR03067.1 B-cell lymphoma 3-encoded protein [Colletotrichum higginsianum IMI 349063]
MKRHPREFRTWGYQDPVVARMDPLSITASVITLLGTVAASAKALEAVRGIQNAPKQVATALNEVTDLRAVVGMIEHSINDLSDDEKRKHKIICQSLYDLASKANGTLQELNTIIKKVFPKRTIAGSEEHVYVLSRRMWLREKSAIERHFLNIQSTRKNLDSALNSLNAARVGVRSEAHIVLQTSIEKLEESVMKAVLEQKTHDRALEPPSYEERGIPRNENSSLKQATSGISVDAFSNWGIEQCDDICPCDCHVKSTVEAPRWIRGLFGTLFYTYSGSPVFGRLPCNYIPCRKTGDGGHQYTYYFPSWWLARALYVSFSRQNLIGIGGSWTFSIPKMVDGGHPIWRFVNSGTVRQVADLLPKFGVSTCDINKDGKSLLHFAVEWKRQDMCSFLLQSGVNRFFEDLSGVSAAMMAWELVLPPDASKDLAHNTEVIQSLFKKDEVFDNLRFSKLHHALLTMTEESFSRELKLSFSLLNQQDALGRTPLAWAAAQGMPGKARQLLEVGAASDIVDKHGKTALHWACAAKAKEVVQILLDHDAPIEARDIIGRTPIWEAAHAPDSHEILALLVERGAEIDSRDDIYARTPLHLATYQGKSSNVTALLKLGADIEAKMTSGRTPLLNAIAYNQLSTLEILIKNGARTDAVEKTTGEGILHLAARFGPPKVMKRLQASNLEGVKLLARDAQGRTAAESFRLERPSSYYAEVDPTENVDQAFEDLCLRVEELEMEAKEFCGLCV